jgi:FKBP-type peptidyl-prolyl cis-trans isomerase 2
MANVKENDFVEIEYTGKTKDDNYIFDTTNEKTAKENGLYDPRMMTYGPITICVGQHQVLEGLDKNIAGKETGKKYTVNLVAAEAFGKKDPKLLKIVNTNIFKKEKINPMPGLQVNIDGTIRTIKTVTGGRTIVDFNHPLSGKDISYELKVNSIVTDDTKKITSFVSMQFNLKPEAINVTIDAGKNALVKFKEGVKMKNFNLDMMTKSLKELIGVNNVSYEETDKKEQQATAAANKNK